MRKKFFIWVVILLTLFSCAHQKIAQDDSKRLLSEEANIFNSSTKQDPNVVTNLDYQIVEDEAPGIPAMQPPVVQPQLVLESPKQPQANESPNVQESLQVNIPEPKTIETPLQTVPTQENFSQSPSVALVMYTPLWIYIPAPECAQVIPSNRYPNGACIRRH